MRRHLAREAQFGADVARAVDNVPQVQLRFEGLCMARGAILVRAIDVDGTGDVLRTRLAREVPGDVETNWTRAGLWYMSLVHFASEVADPRRLVEWVENRCPEIGTATFDEIHLSRFDFDGRRAVPSSLQTVSLDVSPRSAR